ncbi:MAG: aspartyl protease family protein [Nitrosomonadaceae bacterium]
MVPNHVPLVLAKYHSEGTTYQREHKLYGCQNCWQAKVSCSSPKPISVATIETSHITLYANSDGHFNVTSIINDKGFIRFLVDTGATMVTISNDEAKRLDITPPHARRRTYYYRHR